MTSKINESSGSRRVLPPNPVSAQSVHLLKGILWIVFAFAGVAIMSALGKAAGSLPTGELVLFQNLISLILFSPWAFRQGPSQLSTDHLGLHLLRAGAGLLSQAMMFIAVKKMALVNAVLLSNSAPLFIPIVSWLWLRQKITVSVALSLGIGFSGVVLILNPGVGFLSNPAALVALAGAFFSAFALVSVNRLSLTEPVSRILFYYFLFSSVVAMPWAIATWHHPTSREWLFLLGIGLSMALSQWLIVLAYQEATASDIAPFNYTVVIFSALIDWIVWHRVPGWLSLTGVVLVAAGGVLSLTMANPRSIGHWGWLGFAHSINPRREK